MNVLKALCALVSKKTITMEQALEECGLAEKEFVEECVLKNTLLFNYKNILIFL